jgi:hypothetical protein
MASNLPSEWAVETGQAEQIGVWPDPVSTGFIGSRDVDASKSKTKVRRADWSPSRQISKRYQDSVFRGFCQAQGGFLARGVADVMKM